MQFLFMRHGQTEANIAGLLSGGSCTSPLTNAGREQIRLAAETLAASPPSLIAHSGAVRARQTAEILQARLKLPAAFIEEPGMLERHFGAWEGLPFDSVKIRFLAGEMGEGGETPEVFHARVKGALERFSALQGNVLVVSHGMVWHALHDLHGQSSVPWIGNGDVYRVTLSGTGLVSEAIHVKT